ncbi:uncharacterized protein LOC109824407 [Asparagus officinalis]|uniref:uncharacterized protein LOC109824407 n=1 Tax=Asparagus officinalis TaxID=4686 RepID=UPI00098E8269|nr:uncharacterized protein LOC109824407 [Asparagus officinalis]
MSLHRPRFYRCCSSSQHSEREAPVASSYGVEFLADGFPPYATSGCNRETFTASVDRQTIDPTPQFNASRPEEIHRLIRDGGRRSLCQLITDAIFTEDSISTQALEKSDYLFGDHAKDPTKLTLDDDHWLNDDGESLLDIPSISHPHSLAHLETQAVRRQMSWNLTDDHDQVHCGFVSHHKTPGSDGHNHIRGLRPGILGLDIASSDEVSVAVHTVRNRLAVLGRKLPLKEFRCFSWSYSPSKK